MVTGVESIMSTNTVPTAQLHSHAKDGPIKTDRRSNKPIMEKRRRARINNCLNELKTLLLDYSKKDSARHSKLEKADILEKTVKHLQELQRQQAVMQQAVDPKIINKFKAGFTDCANEVSRFPGIDPGVKRRLLQHLNNCLNGVKTDMPTHSQQGQSCSIRTHQIHNQLFPSPPSSPEQDRLTVQQQPQTTSHLTTTPNNSQVISSSHIQQTLNGYFLPNGLQTFPSKLANGNVALILPQGSQKPPQIQHSTVLQNITHMSNVISSSSPLGQIIMTVPTRTPSTGSASSYGSSSYNQNMIPHCSIHYSPHSPNPSYELIDCKSVRQSTPVNITQPIVQQPLSLVVKKNIKEEEQPWRPW